MESTIIIFSTVTGNAFKLAQTAKEALGDCYGPYNIRYAADKTRFDNYVLCYWCNHGTCDDDTIEFVSKLKGKNILLLGTLGADPNSAHAENVVYRVNEIVLKENNLLGHYLCQGSIDLKRTAERLEIPFGEKGHLSLERYEKQKLSQGHPDETDLFKAQNAVKTAFGES